MTAPFHLYRTDEDRLRVAHIAEETRSEGPGYRFAIWLQGCEIRCPGCCNPELFDFEAKSAREMKLGDIAIRMHGLARFDAIEGISLLGGEPFHQAKAAGILAAAAQDFGLSVTVFTGYTLDVLRKEKAAEMLLAHTDLLIAGPFLGAERSVERPWIGSANQEMHLLTDRYRDHPDLKARHAQSVHVCLQDGELTVSGWPGVVEAVRSVGKSDKDKS